MSRLKQDLNSRRFYAQLQALNASTSQATRPPLEPRRARRQKARNAAAKPNRSVGAAAAPDTSVSTKKENW